MPRLDEAPSLTDLVGPTVHSPTPPPYGSTIIRPTPSPVPPPPSTDSVAVGPVLLRDGSTLPPPNAQPVS